MKMRRNSFDLSHERKLSCDMGKLIPIMCEEVLPGDHFKNRTSLCVRLSPLLAPMMHRVDVHTHFFFVPNRLIWSNWEKFITGGEDGKDATVWPTIAHTAVANGSLADYLGIPLSGTWSNNVFTPGNFTAPVSTSALPFRAYNLIYNEWYRDQNLQSLVALSKGDGPDSTTAISLLARNWEKDYFTSALLWAQRGDPVTLPLGDTAPVERVSNATAWQVYTAGGDVKSGGGAIASDGSGNLSIVSGVSLDPDGGLEADLSNATASSINDIRAAFQVQKWMERNARSGSRYVESILAHFGVRSSDARLQRPEFLGGGRSPVVVSEVLQTSETSVNSPQGAMAGHGFSVQNSHAFDRAFEEHGFVIGIMSIMPRTAYQQGLRRMWSRDSRYSYYWPEFANLGEQAVKLKELYLTGGAGDATELGFQGRYDEYRRCESTVHGQFRDTLNFWHMGRIFESAPSLNSAFVTCDPTKRISAVTDEHNCLVQAFNDLKAIRPLPLVGEPGFVDH